MENCVTNCDNVEHMFALDVCRAEKTTQSFSLRVEFQNIHTPGEVAQKLKRNVNNCQQNRQR